MTQQITWQQFQDVDIRLGTIVSAEVFPEARNPAYKLKVDFGPEIGVLKSSAQITDKYSLQQLEGKRVLGVVNFPPKQIGPMRSECLIVGFHDSKGEVALACVDSFADGPENGAKLA